MFEGLVTRHVEQLGDVETAGSMLRSQGVCEERLKKFKATSQRIRRCAQSKSATGSFCHNCEYQMADSNLHKIIQIADSFARLRKASTDCKLCRLVLMSLRNKLPEIDAKLNDDNRYQRKIKLAYDKDGGTDIDETSLKVSTIDHASLLETFWIQMPEDTTGGVVKVGARIAQKISGRRDLSRGLIYIDSFLMAYTKSRTFGSSSHSLGLY